MTGFVRMSWDDAMTEIATKHKAIKEKYGSEAIYNMYATANQNLFQRLWRYGVSSSTPSVAGQLIGGSARSLFSYSTHQHGFFGTAHTGWGTFSTGVTCTTNDLAGVVKHAVLWGSNSMTTVNRVSNSSNQAFNDMRDAGGYVRFIGPEFVDTGVLVSDEWIQSKPYTDTAIINAMIYEMINNTFNTDGSLKADAWLDVDYLDTCVHGFFDSPEYWVNDTTREIAFSDQGTGWTKISEVPAGRSLSAYIMGSDTRLTLARYDVGGSYVAKQYATNGTDVMRNGATCSYVNSASTSTKYKTKLDFNTPKTPEWAEAISGVPAATIRELAEVYAKQDIVYSEWSGGLQKQADGVVTLFALQALLLVSKTFGITGAYLGGCYGTQLAPQADSSYVTDDLPAPTTVRSTNGGSVLNYNVTGTVPDNPTVPHPSCTAWYNTIRFAFGDVMKDASKGNGAYTGKYMPDTNVSTDVGAGKVYHDDGGAKSLINWKRNADGTIPTYQDDKGDTFYDWVGRTGADGTANAHDGTPTYSGTRFIFNEGGNIPLGQHECVNDTREMLESIPVITDPSDPDDFCMVVLDNFLSPTPRWADYVLPGATSWEQEQAERVNTGSYVFMPVTSAPPGESKSCRDFSIALLRAYESVDSSTAGAADIFIDASNGGETFYDKHKDAYDKSGVASDSSSRFYGKTFEEALDVQYLTNKPASNTPTATATKTALRTSIDTYLASSDKATTPYVWASTVSTAGNTYNNGNSYPESIAALEPNQTGKATVYSDRMVFQYENRFAKWHGYLGAAGNGGQSNKDLEGDPIVYPIPLYHAYEDYYMEAYGYFNNTTAVSTDYPFLLTTTHDHQRVHSTHAENPLLRELTHRTKGGALYSGNDYGTYALSDMANGDSGEIPRLNKSIQDNDTTRASYSEFWMNKSDATALGIADGDLVKVENPVGAVRVIARLSERCTPGFVGLHQGCWYDPDPTDGVDDGGCCNTLMAQKPSRIDHGNGQQSAMVKVTKVV